MSDEEQKRAAQRFRLKLLPIIALALALLIGYSFADMTAYEYGFAIGGFIRTNLPYVALAMAVYVAVLLIMRRRGL